MQDSMVEVLFCQQLMDFHVFLRQPIMASFFKACDDEVQKCDE